MIRKKQYTIAYGPRVYEHLEAIDNKYYSLVKNKIYEQLRYDPLKETKNRKPLTKPTWLGEGIWELRFGHGNIFRVFYEVIEINFKVNILAIALKKRNRLYFGGKVVEL